MRRARKANPLANRIKRLMQTDEDVGKIAQASPVLIGADLCHAAGCCHQRCHCADTADVLAM